MKARLDAAGAWLWARRRLALRAWPVWVPALLVLAVMVRYSGSITLPDHSVPEGFVLQPPPTTLPIGVALPPLPSVDGTTTSVPPPNTGFAHLSGNVTDGNGAGVPGAQVRVERAVLGGGFQVFDVFADAVGHWDLPGIGGGRYRVRAFLAPTLAQTEAEVFFLQWTEQKNVDLRVSPFGEPAIAVASAPEVPLLDEPFNVAVRVTGRFVDGDGFVRVQPLVGGFVDVVATGPVRRDTVSGTLVTDANGTADLQFTCTGLGAAQVQVSVRATVDALPTLGTFTLPACVDPASLTTTTTEGPTTTGGEGPTTTGGDGPTTTAGEPTTTTTTTTG